MSLQLLETLITGFPTIFGSAERKVWDKYNGRSNSKERSLTLLFGQQYCSYDYEPTILVLGDRQP
ncbi:MAG: hypothetical protein O4807_01045, partial [Trichodesmium sp. St19_bin2]|nr:hypothetical protein [Trichodesmium sp. St19_bin2]